MNRAIHFMLFTSLAMPLCISAADTLDDGKNIIERVDTNMLALDALDLNDINTISTLFKTLNSEIALSTQEQELITAKITTIQSSMDLINDQIARKYITLDRLEDASERSQLKIEMIPLEEELSTYQNSEKALIQKRTKLDGPLSKKRQQLENLTDKVNSYVTKQLVSLTATIDSIEATLNRAKSNFIEIETSHNSKADVLLAFTDAEEARKTMNAYKVESIKSATQKAQLVQNKMSIYMNHLKEYYELLTNNIDLVKEMIISQNQLNKFAPLVQIAVNENRNKVIEIQKMHTKVLRSTKIEFRKAEELSYTVTKLIKATAVSRAKEIEKALKLGIESFNDALYLQSYSQLKKLFWLDMSHRELNFYLGRSAFELEDYDSAISAYERILILFPDDVRTRVEIARSYFKLKMYDQAKNAFEKVLLMPIPETVRKNILFYMSYIDQSRKHSFLSTSLSLGYLIDDNVKNGNEYVPEALKSVQGDTPINPKIADNAYLASLNLSYLYDMFDKDGFYLQSNSSFYAQKYSKKEAKEADVMFGSITAGVGYKYERFNISIPIGYEKLNYGGNDYFSSITIGLNTMIPRNSDDYYLVNVKHQIKKHVQASDASRDGVNDDVMLGYQFFMLNGSSSLTSAFTYTRERADDQTNKRSDIDYDSLKLSANLFSRLFGVLSINSHYAFRYLRYQDVSNTTFSQIDPKNENRTDIVHNFGLNFGYSFLKKSAINLSLSKVIASSLYHDLFKYDKQSISVMLEQRF